MNGNTQCSDLHDLGTVWTCFSLVLHLREIRWWAEGFPTALTDWGITIWFNFIASEPSTGSPMKMICRITQCLSIWKYHLLITVPWPKLWDCAYSYKKKWPTHLGKPWSIYPWRCFRYVMNRIWEKSHIQISNIAFFESNKFVKRSIIYPSYRFA